MGEDKLSLLKKTLYQQLTAEIKQNKLKDFILSVDYLDGLLLSAFAALQVGLKISSKKFVKGALALQIVYQNLLARDHLLDNYNLTNFNKEEISNLLQKDKVFNQAYTLAREVKNTLFLENFSKIISETTEGRILQEKEIGVQLSFRRYKKINQLKKGSLFHLFFSFPFLLKQKKYSQKLPQIADFGEKLGLFHQYLEDFLDYSLFVNMNQNTAPLQNYKNQKWTLPCFFIPLFSWGKDLKSFLIFLLEHPLSILEESYNSFLAKEIQWVHKKSKLVFAADQYLLFELLLKQWVRKIKKVIYFESKYKLMVTDLKKHFLQIQIKGKSNARNKSLNTFPLLQDFVNTKGHLEKKWLLLFKKGNLINYNFFAFLRPLISKEKQASFFAIMLFAYLLNDVKTRYRKDKEIKVFFFIWETLLKQSYQYHLPLFPFLVFLIGETKKSVIPLDYLLLLIQAKKKEINGTFYPACHFHKKDLYYYTLNFGGVIGLWLLKSYFSTSFLASKNKTKRILVKNIANSNQVILTFARAIQLTEILKNMKIDLQKQQIYLPFELLEENQLTIDNLFSYLTENDFAYLPFAHQQNFTPAVPISGSYKKMLAHFIKEIEEYYQYALARTIYLPIPLQKPLVIFAFLYRYFLTKIIQKNYDNLSATITLSWFDKLKQFLKALYYLAKVKKKPKNK